MAMFTRVLCPVDSSPIAARALGFAQQWTHAFGGEIRVIGVRPPLTALGMWATANLMLPREALDERERAIERLRDFARSAGAGSTADVALLDGPIVAEILREARDWRADVVVMGTHGASGFERLFLGSVTERVLRKTPVPVLAVPPHAPAAVPAALRTVLCALDRSPTAMAALTHAVAIAREATAQLAVVHVVEHMIDEPAPFSDHFDTEACFRAIESDLRGWYAAQLAPVTSGVPTSIHLRCGRAAKHVLEVAAEQNADIVVLGSAGASALFGSTAHDVVRQSHVPVLVVPPRERLEGVLEGVLS